MKIAVLVRRVPDTAFTPKIASDGRSVDLTGVKFVLSPYDEHAVEEAIRIKEKLGADVIVISVGPGDTKEVLRSALAMGADSAVLITGPGVEALSSRGVAKALAAILKTLSPDLVLSGKQAVDDDGAQTGERVAELLGLTHASMITRLVLDGAKAEVDRPIEGGLYTFETALPALFSEDKGINTPRYPTLPNIMKAKKKPIDEKTLADLGLGAADLASGLSVMSLRLPQPKRLTRVLQGERAACVQELARLLREEAKVL